jgi:hypothetical protein
MFWLIAPGLSASAPPPVAEAVARPPVEQAATAAQIASDPIVGAAPELRGESAPMPMKIAEVAAARSEASVVRLDEPVSTPADDIGPVAGPHPVPSGRAEATVTIQASPAPQATPTAISAPPAAPRAVEALPPAPPPVQAAIAPAPTVPLATDQAEPGIPAYWSLHLAEAASLPVERQMPDRRLPDRPGLPAAAPSAPAEAAPLAVIAPEPPDPPIGVAQALHATQPQPLSAWQVAPPPQLAPPQTLPAQLALPQTLPAELATIVSARPESPVELRLSPKELGHLRVSLTHEGEALRIAIQVERPETLDLIRRHADVLMTEIRNAGFTGGTFSFSAWGGAGFGDRRHAQPALPEAEGKPLANGPAPALPSSLSSSLPDAGGLNLRL